MDFFKALIPGFILTFVVCGVLGSAHSDGGWLHIQTFYIHGHKLYWSWMMMIVSIGLSWVLIAITPK